MADLAGVYDRPRRMTGKARAANEQILIPYGQLTVGGIETLIVRLANVLAQEGHRVTVMSQGGPLVANLSKNVSYQHYDALNDGVALARAHLQSAARSLVLTFDPFGLAFAYRLLGPIPPTTARVVSGIFHPRAYFFEDDRPNRPFNWLLIGAARDDQLFFMNEECRRSHAAHFRRSFAGSLILPIGVRSHGPRPRPSAGERFRIASVGRLVRFKDYNRHIPEMTKILVDGGAAVNWDVFGEGELRHEIDAAAYGLGLTECVRTQGTLPHPRFAETIAGYDLFVGMGTAALEAASLGVPTIVAVDRGGDRTYGFLHELPFGNVGEQQETAPRLAIADLAAEVVAMDAAGRVRLGEQCRSAALRYGMDRYARTLIDYARAAAPPRRVTSWLAATIYHEANDGVARRALRAIKHAFQARL